MIVISLQTTTMPWVFLKTITEKTHHKESKDDCTKKVSQAD